MCAGREDARAALFRSDADRSCAFSVPVRNTAVPIRHRCHMSEGKHGTAFDIVSHSVGIRHRCCLEVGTAKTAIKEHTAQDHEVDARHGGDT